MATSPTTIDLKRLKAHTTISILCTIGLLTMVAISGVFAYQILQDIQKTRVFDLTDLSKKYVLDRIEIFENGTTEKVSFDKRMIIDVKLTAKDLTVNTPIRVDADIIFNDVPDDAWKKFPEVLILAFPGSNNMEISVKPSEIQGGAIKMKKMEHVHIYRGIDQLVYSMEGKYGYVILTPEIAELSSLKETSGVVTLNLLTFDLDELVEPKSTFHIFATSPIIGNEISLVGLSISLIVLGIGIIQLRPQFISGVCWLYDYFFLQNR